MICSIQNDDAQDKAITIDPFNPSAQVCGQFPVIAVLPGHFFGGAYGASSQPMRRDR
jgi:hypothetical protein